MNGSATFHDDNVHVLTMRDGKVMAMPVLKKVDPMMKNPATKEALGNIRHYTARWARSGGFGTTAPAASATRPKNPWERNWSESQRDPLGIRGASNGLGEEFE